MRFDSVHIARVEHVDAPVRVTSRELEERMGETLRRLKLPMGMLESLTGIVARRVWEEGQQPSDAATAAARKTLERADIDPSRVGALISTSVCRDFIEPSVASLVHARLGLSPSCVNFDLANACLGFLNGMEMVGNMIERGQIDYGLVVDGESSRFVVDSTIRRLNGPLTNHDDYRRNFATLTLGSGAAAMLLCRAELAPDAHRFVGGVTLAATEHNDLCRGQVDGMETNTKGLLDAGVALAGRTFALGKAELGWTSEKLDELVLHQVSKTHTEKLAGALELDLDKVLRTYPEFGNVGPAAVPIALSKASESGRLDRGKRVSLMGIGSGLNCYMAEVVW
jgi:3-oxoacyl-[acyl-carrier-protein] synthase-3